MKIGLFCAAGFSTGMLVNNMKVAAQELGIDAEIEAYSQAKLADFAPEIDVALLGPQVAYTLDKSIDWMRIGFSPPIATSPIRTTLVL